MDRARASSERAFFLRPLPAGLVIASLPVVATLAMGGADWHVAPGVVLSWYATSCDAGGGAAWLCRPGVGTGLAGGMLGLGLTFLVARLRTPTPRDEACVAAGLAAALLGAVVLWTGGGELGPLSLHRPDPCLLVALALVALGARRGLAWRRPFGGALRGLGASVALGIVLLGLVMRADRWPIEASLARATARSAAAMEGDTGARPPDVLWIVVDTLRADAVGAYRALLGAAAGPAAHRPEAPATPFLDALAASGVVVERARAPAPWTLPSMASAFTARWPSSLDPEGRGRARAPDALIGLPATVPSWIGSLREAGYYTVGFQKNPFLQPGSGFERDFDLYRMVGGDRAELESGAQLVAAVHRWAERVAAQGLDATAPIRPPWLLYVHFMDPHVDYRAPLAWRSPALREAAGGLDGRARSLHRRLAEGPPLAAAELERLRDLYAAEVAYLDAQLARLVDGLRARGVLGDAALIVVSADHGEQLGEHGGFEHGDLHLENVAVPFVLSGAGLAPGRIEAPRSLLDLGPSVLDLVGVPSAPGVEGRSVFESHPMGDGATSSGANIFTEYGERLRLERGRWVLRLDGPGVVALFDRESDPAERRDVAARHPGVVARLLEEVEAHRARGAAAEGSPAWQPDEHVREALRALGYGD